MIKDEHGKPVDSALTTRVSTHCCLGFACLQAGVPLNRTYRDYPGDLRMEVPGLNEPIDLLGRQFKNTVFSRDAATINDDRDIDDEERKRQLSKLAIAHGHTFTFIP